MIAMLAFSALPTAAQDIAHLGTNQLVLRRSMTWRFRTQREGHRRLSGRGPGIIWWRASFRFSGLEANASYTVVIKAGSPTRTLPTRLP